MNNSQELPLIRVRNLQKRFGSLKVLKGIDLDVPEGQVVSIIGPSGSGKSTLLRILMTLEWPTEGRVEIAGESMFTMERNGAEVKANPRHLRRVRGHVGMVFQHFNLFPHMRVLKNVTEAPMHVLGLSRDEAEDRAVKVLQKVDLADKLDAHPSQLSGGQKQRVAIARALAMQPRIMLFDEITSALDPELVGGILSLLRDIAKSGEMTMLIVTHEMKFAQDSSDRTLFFDQGVILEDDLPERIFSAPAHERTREFLQSVLDI